ncbi:hypothetical protein ACFYST_20660 [Kitasatospora sp. NPDC004614]|uniref:DUF7919 family protein n=1 Tax=unclassified Kitasatospora TaxID=2633591 RepID=UPI0036BBAE93
MPDEFVGAGVLHRRMTFFRDLSPYTYSEREVIADGPYFATFAPTYRRVNVGWLSRWHRYSSGAAPEGFLVRLLDIVQRQRVNGTRGFHSCGLCPPWRRQGGALTVEHQGGAVALGSSEIRVPGRAGEVFAAPTLVVHYVSAHGYLPPPSFVEAVLACPEGWMSGPDAAGVPDGAERQDYSARVGEG